MWRASRKRQEAMPQMPCPLPLVSPQGTPQAANERPPARCWHGTERAEGQAVTVSIPLVALLGAVVFVAWRYMKLRIWQAVLCLLFGFFLDATTAGPSITHLVTAIVQWLVGPKP
jgi:hypothetical protein